MMFSLFPYKWTCLLGVALLASLLWSATFRDELSHFIALLIFLFFLVSAISSVAAAVFHMSKDALQRILINVIIALLLFPTIRLGGYFRGRLFLRRLVRFQEVTNLIVEAERTKAQREVFSAVVPLPLSYSDLNVLDRVQVSSTKENITVRYATRDSSSLGHSGYMYRSDDDPLSLRREYPNTEYARVAPHWFFFSE
jgi:hypothetical protein